MTDVLPLASLLRQSRVIPRRFYARETTLVAKDLLGKILLHGETAGRIVEVEAYLGTGDLAAHSARGITQRTQVIFGSPGHAYVYFIYGMYECLNFVTEPPGKAGCVLIRAVEPLCGLGVMQTRRAGVTKIEQLANGPGKLTLALGITRDHYGVDLTLGPLVVRELRKEPAHEITTTPRIGIRECADWPLRFFIAGNRFVSTTRPSKPAKGS